VPNLLQHVDAMALWHVVHIVDVDFGIGDIALAVTCTHDDRWCNEDAAAPTVPRLVLVLATSGLAAADDLRFDGLEGGAVREAGVDEHDTCGEEAGGAHHGPGILRG